MTSIRGPGANLWADPLNNPAFPPPPTPPKPTKLQSIFGGQTSGQPGGGQNNLGTMPTFSSTPGAQVVSLPRPPIPNMPPQTGVTTTQGGQNGLGTSTYSSTPQPFAGATGSVTGVTNIVPGQSLIGTQINPVTGQRTQGVMGQVDTARDRYAGAGDIPFEALNADTSQSSGLYDELLKMARGGGGGISGGGGWGGVPPELSGDIARLTKEIGSGPDRGKLAADAYQLMLERSQPDFDQRTRALGQNTAALGRVGSGIYGSQLTDLNTARERELGLDRRELATGAAGHTLADKMASLSALRGVSGDLSANYASAGRAASEAESERFNRMLGLTRDIYGRETDQFGRQVGERNTGLDVNNANFDRRRSIFGDLAGEEDRLRGYDTADRQELRGERGYQTELEQDAIRRRTGQREAEESYLDAAERRRQNEIASLGGSFGGAPTDLMAGIGAGTSAGGADALGGAGDWLQQYLLRQQLAKRPAATARVQPSLPANTEPDYEFLN